MAETRRPVKLVRFTPEIVTRATALVAALWNDPQDRFGLRRLGVRRSTSAVLRLAADRGLAELEQLLAATPDGER
jgi:hypothetical protein